MEKTTGMKNCYRDMTVREIGEQHIGQSLRMAGWVENIRDHGGVSFIDLRDMYGVLQVVIRRAELLQGLARETCVSVRGLVEKRDEDTYNPRIPTGTIELEAHEITVLGKVYQQLPFEVMTSKETREDVRLKYRYLDMRNAKVRDGAWICGGSDAHSLCFLAGGGQGLYCALPEIQGKVLRASPGTPAV